MEVRKHRTLEQRFSNESGIQEDDPLQQTENIKKLASILGRTPSSQANTSLYNIG